MKTLTAPQEPIVIIDPKFCFNVPIKLLLKEKMLSFKEEDYVIKDTAGNAWFKLKGKLFSLREKRVLFDIHDQPILNVKEELFALFRRKKQKVFRGNDSSDLMFLIRPRWKIFGEKITINCKHAASGKDYKFVLRSNWINRKATIWYYQGNDRIAVAKITRKINAKSMFTSSQDYSVEIAANIDIAFIMSIAIAFDEAKDGDKDD